MHNAIITGDFSACLNFDDADTFVRADEDGGAAPADPGPHLRFRNSIIECVNGANFAQE
ncbi:MAG: hypothetical protein U5R48_17690 [Gammaproteobacteria bacterium]|nr:hypothetical protein [Gammaproteobacteria bacterium]